MWLARYFFFRAEDGIRFWSVTGVQTCALPICRNVCHFSFTRATIRANEMIATPICGPFLTRKSPFLLVSTAVVMLFLSAAQPLRVAADSTQSDLPSNAKRAYIQTREVWQKNPNDPDAAWQFARAC